MSTFTKSNLLDDPAPGGGTPAARIFQVVDFINADFTDRETLRGEFLTAGGASVSGIYDALLWLKLGGVWTLIGSTLERITAGHLVAFPFGDLDAEYVDGYFQITNIVAAAGAATASFTVNTLNVSGDGPKDTNGIPFVSLSAPVVVVGGATAANQVLEIAQLVAANAELVLMQAQLVAANAALTTANATLTSIHTDEATAAGQALALTQLTNANTTLTSIHTDEATAAGQALELAQVQKLPGTAGQTALPVVNVPGSAYISAAREKTAIVKGTSGTLFSFLVNLLSTTTAQFVQLHNAANATPVATATLVFPLGPITAGQDIAFNLDSMDTSIFTAGIKIALSTTEDTYTAPGANDGWFYARKS